MVAGFDLMYNRGNTATARGVLMVPKVNLTSAQMNSSNTTANGYKGSLMYTSTIPTVVSNLQRVLGSYLLPMKVLVTNAVNTSQSSMAGSGFTGASSGWEWTTQYATLMTEVQVYGSTVFSSSFYDIGEGCFKLPVFNFVSFVEFERSSFWLRAVASSTAFALATYVGYADHSDASHSHGVRPLILLG